MQSGLYSDSPPLLPLADAGREGKVSHNSVDCLPAIFRKMDKSDNKIIV